MQPFCPLEFGYPVPALKALLDQLPWSCQYVSPIFTDFPLNAQAHLSAFSAPEESYQAFSCGSVIASESSCADTLANAFNPCEPDWLLCGSQPGSPSRLKKNANCTE